MTKIKEAMLIVYNLKSDNWHINQHNHFIQLHEFKTTDIFIHIHEI